MRHWQIKILTPQGMTIANITAPWFDGAYKSALDFISKQTEPDKCRLVALFLIKDALELEVVSVESNLTETS